MAPGDALLCYCRAGFEPELAAELSDRAAHAGFPGYARTDRNSGYVEFFADDIASLTRALPFGSLIFARQKLRRFVELKGLDPKDRITPIVRALETTLGNTHTFGELWVEHPDSDEAKPLAGLARAFGNALRPALRKGGWLTQFDDSRKNRLHVVFLAGDHVLLAIGEAGDSAPWPLGIPRLRMHADAPSRSALKLEEAVMVLLNEKERERLFREGMRGADLGAAPGGWSWVLMRQGLRVISVDNGPLQEKLLESGRIEHLREDGFHWHPR